MAKAAGKGSESPDSGTLAPPLPFGSKPLRTFALVVALPSFLLYVASAVMVIGALAMMAKEIDRLEDARGVAAMHAALDSFVNGLGDAVSDEGTWNEAFLNVVVNSDPAWMDATWGASARIGNAYDTVLVTDNAGIIQFGETNAGALTGDIASFLPAARTMLRDLDKGISATGDATSISRFAADEKGLVGLAAISIHQTTPNEMAVPRQKRRVLWIAKHLTPALLQDMAARYQTPMAALVTTAAADESSIDLNDADGRLAGTIAWTPDRPGDAAFTHAALVASAVFFGIGIVMVLGLGMIRRAMVKRAALVAAAFPVHQHVDVDAPAATTPGPVRRPLRRLADAPAVTRSIDGVVASDFTIDYQPIFDLRAETLIGVEGLLRWTNPDKTILAQESLEAHPLAAMMERVGMLSMRHASAELAPLLGLMLTVTATPGQLQSPVFAEKLVGTLAATHMTARRMQLCLDADLLPPVEQLVDVLTALRNAGLSIALGNFTLGPANFDYVRAGLADRIRLSPQIVAGIDADPLRLSLVEATIGAARTAGFAVTVPGIDRKEDVAPLLRLGCREFQGDLFAPPMALAALSNLVLAPAKADDIRKAG